MSNHINRSRKERDILHTILTFTNTYIYIQGVSRLEDITAEDDFLGLSDQKMFI